MDYGGSISHYFGITGLDFRLTAESRERILWASIIPFALLCAMLIDLSLDLYFGRLTVPGMRPEGWQRVQNASVTISALLPFIALPMLFLAGVSRWSRAEASWMLAVGAVLTVEAVAAGVAATAIRFFELNPVKQYDLLVVTWSRWAQNFALLAAGYFFVAYRGLAVSQRRRRLWRREAPVEGAGDE